MILVNLILALLLFVPYHLALAYIGVSVSFKKTILPSLCLGLIAFLVKVVFGASSIAYTIIIMIACAILLHFFNKIDFLLGITGSLLSFITFVMGSLLLACPFLISIGFEITKETNGIQWIILNLAEFSVPILVLIILKISKFSLSKYLSTI